MLFAAAKLNIKLNESPNVAVISSIGNLKGSIFELSIQEPLLMCESELFQCQSHREVSLKLG